MRQPFRVDTGVLVSSFADNLVSHETTVQVVNMLRLLGGRAGQVLNIHLLVPVLPRAPAFVGPRHARARREKREAAARCPESAGPSGRKSQYGQAAHVRFAVEQF